jgi:HAD domain in Swiss Army Knife RNA repair proteins
MRTILFLDIDGVLNTEATTFGAPLPSAKELAAIDALPKGACLRSSRTDDTLVALRSLERPLVARLDALVKASGAEVVIHSTWRRLFTKEGILWALRYAGYEGEIADVVPDMVANQRFSEHVTRGRFILQWFYDQGLEPGQARFAILDDADALHFRTGGLGSQFVPINPVVGLRDKDVARALALLVPSV